MKSILFKKLVAVATSLLVTSGVTQHFNKSEKAVTKVQQVVKDVTGTVKDAVSDVASEIIISAKSASAYEGEYNIRAAINYALEWCAKGFNPEYEANEWLRKGGHCASFVSECLMAGGVQLTEVSRDCNGLEIGIGNGYCLLFGYDYSNVEWSGANNQFNFLKKVGYDWEKACDQAIHVGDLLYYDYTNDKDGDMNHAAICVGIDRNGKPIVAEHSTSTPVRIWDKTVKRTIDTAYVVHMTKTKGLRDTTKAYYEKRASLKVLKPKNAGEYLSAGNTTYNVSSSPQAFSILENDCIDYAKIRDRFSNLTNPVSFMTDQSEYLSAFVNEIDAPIRSTSNKWTWEAMRIFVDDSNKKYIQSMENGLFIHVQDDGRAYAHGKLPSTWEAFDICEEKETTPTTTTTTTTYSTSAVNTTTTKATTTTPVTSMFKSPQKKKTQYRTVRTLTKRSSVKLDSTWTLVGVEDEKSGWKEAVSTARPTETDDLQILEVIAGEPVLTGYTMRFFLYQVAASPYTRVYLPTSINGRFDEMGLRRSYGEHSSEMYDLTQTISVEALQRARIIHPGEYCREIEYQGRNGSSENAYVLGDNSRLWFATANFSQTPTRYRYRYRTGQTTYIYQKSEISDWLDYCPTNLDKDESVETRVIA